MFRVVLDVNVLVSALISRPGIPGRIVRHWLDGHIELVASRGLLAELDRVLSEPRIAERVDMRYADVVRAGLARDGLVIKDPPAERLVPGDPDDDYLVALARAGRAHLIVTGDAHLLEANLDPPGVRPQDFLARLEQLDL